VFVTGEVNGKIPIEGILQVPNTPKRKVGAQNLKFNKMKKLKFFIIGSIFGMAILLVTTPASALRVLDYTWECVGCGGNCLDDVVVTPEMQ